MSDWSSDVCSSDLELPIETPQNRPFTRQVSDQGCADLGLCYPPEMRTFQIGNSPPVSPAQPETTLDWGSLALFFLAGLGLTFTPCVLPMLPILSGVVLRGQLGGQIGRASCRERVCQYG